MQCLSQEEGGDSDDPVSPDTWLTHRGPIINDRGPGSLYHRIQERYTYLLRLKALRERQQNQAMISDHMRSEQTVDSVGNPTKHVDRLDHNSRNTQADIKVSYGNNSLDRIETVTNIFQRALNIRAEFDNSSVTGDAKDSNQESQSEKEVTGDGHSQQHVDMETRLNSALSDQAVKDDRKVYSRITSSSRLLPLR